MTKYVLLTGATGLVGRYLLRDLLLDGHRVAVIVRPTKSESAVERVEAILQFWEEQLDTTLPRPVVLSGDVTERDFGLDPIEIEWIQKHCDRVLHNAAVLTFHGGPDRSGEPWRTNLDGTRNTLAVCEELGITEFHYVSTAYVCGTRQDLVYEHELDAGQTFRNDYEHSKFLAEQVVRESAFLRDLTIYRPTVISGDSRTGYTSTYHGLYMYLKVMSLICQNIAPGPDGVRDTPVQLDMTGDEQRNVVPVDWVSAVIARVFRSRDLHGRTYHLSPIQRITPRQTINAGYGYFNSRGVEFTKRSEVAGSPASHLDKVARDNTMVYAPYEATDPPFDSTNVKRYIPELPCPPIDEEMLHRYWRYGEQDRWGKRRMPKPVIPFRMQQYLEEQVRPVVSGNGHDVTDIRHEIGLDVLGPGGGQWQLVFLDDSLVSVVPGVPSGSCPVVEVSSCDFSRLVEKHKRLTRDALVRLAASSARERSDRQAAVNARISVPATGSWLDQRGVETEGIAAASRVGEGS